MQTTLRAILFDFDGVLANTEPVHLEMFQKVLGEEGIALTREAYFEKYLGLDDRACFAQVYRDFGKVLDEGKAEDLVARKNQALLAYIKGEDTAGLNRGTGGAPEASPALLMPGAKEAVEKASQNFFLAVVSGALKNEIEAVLENAGLRRRFHVIVAADDVSEGKPAPEGFLAAIRLLNRDFVPPSEILLPEECVAIEDSPWGIEAAKKAGIRCLAVMTSYPRDRLREADLVAKDVRTLPWRDLEALFRK